MFRGTIMKRLRFILCAVFVVQVLLSIVLFNREQDAGAFQSDEKLLGLQLQNLDSIVIEAADQTLTLSKQSTVWRMEDHFDSPVANSKLTQISNKIFAINKDWPVATTSTAAVRFKVAEQVYERKISFKKGAETLHTLYLGSSPGFRKIHARIDRQANIYSIELSAFELSTNADDWIDQSLVKMKKADLQYVKMADFSINKQDKIWRLDSLDAQYIENQLTIGQLLDKLTGISYSVILGIEEQADYGLDNAALNFTLIDKEGNQIQYRFAKMANQADYVLKTSSLPYYFKVDEFRVQALQDVKFDTLRITKPENNNAIHNQSAPESNSSEPDVH
jgi:hypothetical protein